MVMEQTLPATVRMVEKVEGYPVLQVVGRKCRAEVALHGAHVISWIPAGEEEVLYVSPKAKFQEGESVRGGIPICWPWFNVHPLNPELPSHGFARNRFWNLEAVRETEESVEVEMSLEHDGWHATIFFELGKKLGISLTTRNLTGETRKLAGALHSYFAVGDLRETAVVGLDGVSYLDTVGTPTRQVQVGEICFKGETDSIYDSEVCVTVSDKSRNRQIRIVKSGSPSTVVWNPWKEKAKRLEDLPDEDYLKFVCVETAISNQSAIPIGPGGSHTLATEIDVL